MKWLPKYISVNYINECENVCSSELDEDTRKLFTFLSKFVANVTPMRILFQQGKTKNTGRAKVL